MATPFRIIKTVDGGTLVKVVTSQGMDELMTVPAEHQTIEDIADYIERSMASFESALNIQTSALKP